MPFADKLGDHTDVHVRLAPMDLEAHEVPAQWRRAVDAHYIVRHIVLNPLEIKP